MTRNSWSEYSLRSELRLYLASVGIGLVAAFALIADLVLERLPAIGGSHGTTRFLLAGAVAVCLTAAACTGHGRTAIIKPAPPLPATSSTTGVVDLSDVELGGVPGRTTSTVVMGPGRAALNGQPLAHSPSPAIGGRAF